jgi:hypothetical protein
MTAVNIEQLKEIVMTEVAAALLRRMSNSHPVKLDLDSPELLLHRLRQTPPTISRLMALHGRDCLDEWRIITGLHQVLEEAFQHVTDRLNLLDWNRRTLVVGAVLASLFAERLRIQLGAAGEPLLDKSRLPPQGHRALLRCADDADKARMLPATLTSRLMQTLWRDVVRCRSAGSRRCCSLRFRAEHDSVQVDWLAEDESVVESEKLQGFIGPALDAVLSKFVTTLGNLHAAGAGWGRVADGLLGYLSPRTANALQVACERNAATGLHLFNAKMRGSIPTEICLFIQPHFHRFGHGACTLSVNRAHHEFILESAGGRLFYFPPILLCARLLFGAGLPCIRIPVVRQPVGGFQWRHPYTGALDSDPLTGVTMLDRNAPVLVEPSGWARSAFPALAHRLAHAAEKDLCLSGQELSLSKLQDALSRQMASGAEFDALRIVTELHGILRRGLCCAHQQSAATPRIHMTPEDMYYVLNASAATPVRIFRYNPRSPSNSKRCVESV